MYNVQTQSDRLCLPALYSASIVREVWSFFFRVVAERESVYKYTAASVVAIKIIGSAPGGERVFSFAKERQRV